MPDSSTSFSANQFDLLYPNGIDAHYWNHSRNHIILSALRESISPNDVMLEVGCAKGVIVRFLREQGVDCYGVELGDPQVVDGVSDFVFTNKDATLLPKEFRMKIKVLALFDVIEHIEHPSQFIEHILESFPNAHTFLVTVPAAPEIWSNFDVFNGHFRRYVPSSLKRDVEAKGMKVKKMSYMYHLLYVAAYIQGKTKGSRNTFIQAPSGAMKVIHRLLSFCFRIEYKLLPSSMKGTSLICVLKKS